MGLAVEAETTLSPRELFFICQGVERILGKDSADPLTPDPIEISIVLYEDLVMNEGELRIPYPHLLKRGVVLAALAELVPEVKHPVLGRTIWELLDELPPERRPIRSGEITSW
ncbi:TPA: 2-amino-4-hydroxy-6-hydroxymethyldihydropteridine diphosphokinase [Candidatus Micrarchaeota archaeon]|nr:2-amino-4-hydroxy-6-hydroxymethyldihydropteridine diphosphokinase [Candidatus Micrarchaeota archaeon]